MANRRLAPARVLIDVSAARCGSREAISVHDSGQDMNPGEARRLADEILAAAAFVDQLAPPQQLKEPTNV